MLTLKPCVDRTLRLLLNPRLAWCLCQEPILSLLRMLAVCIRRMPPPLLPISVGADGNCLPGCASVLVHENPYRDKRTRIILELVLAQEYYLDESFLQVGCQGSNLLAAYSMYSGQTLPHPFLQSSACVQSGEERSWVSGRFMPCPASPDYRSIPSIQISLHLPRIWFHGAMNMELYIGLWMTCSRCSKQGFRHCQVCLYVPGHCWRRQGTSSFNKYQSWIITIPVYSISWDWSLLPIHKQWWKH